MKRNKSSRSPQKKTVSKEKASQKQASSKTSKLKDFFGSIQVFHYLPSDDSKENEVPVYAGGGDGADVGPYRD